MQKTKVFVILLFIFSFVIRVVGTMPGLPFHPDEAHIEDYSRKLVVNIATSRDLNPYTFKYGSFIYYYQALTYALVTTPFFIADSLSSGLFSGFTSPQLSSEVYLKMSFEKYPWVYWMAERISISLLGAISVLVLYKLTHELFDQKTAIIASLLFSVTPLHVRDSRYLTTDIAATLFILIAIYLCVLMKKSGSLRSFIFAGVLTGFSSTVRYFPLAIPVYFVSAILSRATLIRKLIYSFVGLLAIGLGIVAGVPHLFIDSKNIAIFNDDLNRWILPWYQTSISRFIGLLVGFIVSRGQSDFPSIYMLIPDHYYPFYFKYLIQNAFGLVPSIMAIGGIIAIVRKEISKALILAIIPAFAILYSSFYLTAVYERMLIPALPFLSLFAAYFIVFVSSKVPRHRYSYLIASAILLFTVFYFPVKESVVSAYDCSQPTIYSQAEEWLSGNIPDNAKIAQVPPVGFPARKAYVELANIRPNNAFTLEELKRLGFNYFLINTGVLEYYNYQFINNFFVTPQELFDNSFIALSMREYDQRSNLIYKVSKNKTCNPARFQFYDLGKVETNKQKQISVFDFESVDVHMGVLPYGNKPETIEVGVSKTTFYRGKSSLMYKTREATYLGPRLLIAKVDVEPGKSINFSGRAFSKLKKDTESRDGFFRLDFYDKKVSDFTNPGVLTAITTRYDFSKKGWQNLLADVTSPNMNTQLVISFQSDEPTLENPFYLDYLQLNSD